MRVVTAGDGHDKPQISSPNNWVEKKQAWRGSDTFYIGPAKLEVPPRL